MESEKSIEKYLNLSKIEAEIEYARENKISLTIAKFKYEVDLDNAFFFKDLFKKVYRFLNFSTLLHAEKNHFIVIFSNLKLNQSVALFKKLQKKLDYEFNVRIDRVGMSELDDKDDAKDILERVHKYLVMSKRLPIGKIIFGKRDFDFYDYENREDNLKRIFSKDPNIFIYNVYKGIPIKERGKISKFSQDIICIETTPQEIVYLKRYEEFLYIKHKDFPNVIKGYIFNYDLDNYIVCVKDPEILDNSIIERESIRIKPPKPIRAMITYQGKTLGDGIIESISVDAISLKIDYPKVQILKKLKDGEFVLKFKLFAKNSIAIDNIIVKAKLYSVMAPEAVFLIEPNGYVKNKILNYVEACGKDIIQSLKLQMIKVDKLRI